MMTFVTICVVQNEVFTILFLHMGVLRAGDFDGMNFDDLGVQGQGQLSRSHFFLNIDVHVYRAIKHKLLGRFSYNCRFILGRSCFI